MKKIGVGIIIRDQSGNFLLHLRDGKTTLMTNQWSLIGGGVKRNEVSEDAAMREIIEETSLIPSNLVKIGSISFNEDWDVVIYVADVNTLNNKVKLGEGKKMQFFSRIDLLAMLGKLEYSNPFLDYLKKYLDYNFH